MGQLAQAYPQFTAVKAALAMLSVDSLKRARQLADESHPAFPVLSDRDVDVTVAYNVFNSGIAVPSTFLVDPEGIVRWSYVGSNPVDRPEVEHLLEQVAAL